MKRKYDGTDLAKVLIYFGFIAETEKSVFNIVCPFHNDINASLRINLQEGTYFCFGCEESGNAVDFVNKMYPELNELQSCLKLEKIIKSNEIRKVQITIKRKTKKRSRQALFEAQDYYYGLLKTNWKEVEDETSKQIVSYMNERGFTEKDLQLAKCKENKYNIAYPFIFPILDNGEFKGWVSRTMNKYVEKKRKYLYNDGFVKRETLCGNYEKGKVIFICEGYFDYLSLRTKGHIKNVVAILGWHISDGQVNKLKKIGVKKVVSALDSDEKGEQGTKYLKKFFEVERFPFPEGVKDAGEMTEKQMQKSLKILKRRMYETRN